MSRVIKNCTVHFEDGRTLHEIGVLFRDDGWVRIGDKRPFRFYPPRKISHVKGPDERGER